MKNETASNKSSARRLTICGIMIAITLIMAYTPIGMIPLGTVSATISHVPAIITAIVVGPIEGLIVGTAFGIISLFKAITSPSGILDPLFANPLVSVLPRMMIGLTAHYTYKGLTKLFKGRNDSISITIAGCVGSMTNTVLVLGMLYVIYGQKLIEMLAVQNLQAVRAIVLATVTTSGLIEMVVSAIIAVIIAKALKKALHI
jgi:uncharacterized membrane protein